jgi:hypothetical protein
MLTASVDTIAIGLFIAVAATRRGRCSEMGAKRRSWSN